MSKQIFLSRYSLIIRRLQKSPATFEQIKGYLERETELSGENYNLSTRTFQREIKAIYENFNIKIINEKKGDKKYFIKEMPETMEQSHRLLEAYEAINVIKASENFLDHIFFETRKPNGLQHFNILLHAIKNRQAVEFTYFEFWEEIIEDRTAYPLALKEARGRWYVVAIDTNNEQLKAFGLDRMNEINIIKKPFTNKYSYDVNKLFNDSFGIMMDKPQSVILQFSYDQGQYVKNYPLHHSQQIITEDEYVEINLFIAITHDLIMELLSFGAEVKVVSPVSLKKQLKEIYSKALAQYQ